MKVLDFGLAKAGKHRRLAPRSRASRAMASILGTAAYMSPEQARGHSVDKRGDIWAFGCVLYEMLTGRLAFPGDTVSDTIAKILEREPDWSALPGRDPSADSSALAPLPRQGSEAAPERHRRRQDRDRRDRRGAAGASAAAAPAVRAKTRERRGCRGWRSSRSRQLSACGRLGAR